MPFSPLTLKPGVNVESTPAALRSGYSQSNLGRFRNGFFEKLGGWVKYYAFAVSGVPRAIWAWLDLNGAAWLAVGTSGAAGVASLDVISSGVNSIITPQTYTSDFAPNFTTANASAFVTVNDAYLIANSLQANVFTTVEFNTPISIDGLILSGAYPIAVAGTGYQVEAVSAASATRSNATITAATATNPVVITAANNFANLDYVYISGVVGMTQLNNRIFVISAVSGAGFTLTGIDGSGYSAYTSGGSASPGKVPQFTPTSGSATVSVLFQGHGLVTGNSFNFPIATTVGGQSILGTYPVTRVDANNFTINLNAAASNSTVVLMNGGSAELLYYIAQGPVAAGTGYGVGTYGSGTYGVGTGTGSGQLSGTGIAASDWTLDNWNATLMSCPADGGIYAWTPNSGFSVAQLIGTAPVVQA